MLDRKVIVASIPKSSGFFITGRVSHDGKPSWFPRESCEGGANPTDSALLICLLSEHEHAGGWGSGGHQLH